MVHKVQKNLMLMEIINTNIQNAIQIHGYLKQLPSDYANSLLNIVLYNKPIHPLWIINNILLSYKYLCYYYYRLSTDIKNNIIIGYTIYVFWCKLYTFKFRISIISTQKNI